jgi:hypothetical protein
MANYRSENRRFKRLILSDELLLELFSAGVHQSYEVIEYPIPAGTRLINVRHVWPRSIEVMLEHETFEPVTGDEIPLLTPVLRQRVA